MNRPEAVASFRQIFQRDPQCIIRAPGRVNLIGEHTDYNDGWVAPAAIDRATWTAIAPRRDRWLHVHAGNRREEVRVNLDSPGAPFQRHWSDYVRGIAVELERDGTPLSGADVWFAGDIPDSAGLSSSAALEISVGFALLVNSGLSVDLVRLALAGQRTEHRFAGTQCGIMDEFISTHGRAGHALLLDCRTLAHRHLPIPEKWCIVICDSGVKHQLAVSEYNRRREECEVGVKLLKQRLPGIRALRDVSPVQLEEHSALLPDLILRRCRHVTRENERVHAFAAALDRADHDAVGKAMLASHASLRDDYEVSCHELNLLVDIAWEAPGIVGARMTGGGFGGCTVNLVETSAVDGFCERVGQGFAKSTGRIPRVFVSRISEGVKEILDDVSTPA